MVMVARSLGTVIALTIAVLPGIAGGAKPAQGEYLVRGDGVVPATVGGVAGRMRLTPWAPAAPTLNPDYAQRIGLRGGLFGFSVKVGPVKVRGETGVTRLQFGNASFKRRVVWFERRYDAGADGAVGPGGLPVDLIRFQLKAAAGNERSATLPLVQQMFRPATTRVVVGGRTISILFDPQHPRTLATAGAGAALAEGLGGQLIGNADKAEIAFGIARPVRTIRLARPLVVGPLTLESMLVRVADNGSVAGIADADADPEEIVVTAKSKKERRDVIIIGRDQLGGCSSIVFDKRAKLIRLSCA
jgi:hypothetical protein